MNKIQFKAKYDMYFPNSEHKAGEVKTRREWEAIIPAPAKNKFREWFECVK
jgi:hypothetical protein